MITECPMLPKEHRLDTISHIHPDRISQVMANTGLSGTPRDLAEEKRKESTLDRSEWFIVESVSTHTQISQG